MANQIFRNEIKKEVIAALQSYANIRELDHPGLKGRIREIITSKLLKPILPPGVETGTGKIVDSQGNQLAETDIIIYSRSILPPIVYGHSTGLFPIEACIYSIEVKTTLNATEIKDALKKVNQLSKLKYLDVIHPMNFVKPIGRPSLIIPALFAFSSDLEMEASSEIDRYRKYDQDADIKPRIPVICIPKRGYWWFKYDEPDKKWIHHSPTQDFDEIIDFIGGIANTIPRQILEKGIPHYGHYIIQQRPFTKE